MSSYRNTIGRLQSSLRAEMDARRHVEGFSSYVDGNVYEALHADPERQYVTMHALCAIADALGVTIGFTITPNESADDPSALDDAPRMILAGPPTPIDSTPESRPDVTIGDWIRIGPRVRVVETIGDAQYWNGQHPLFDPDKRPRVDEIRRADGRVWRMAAAERPE